MLRAIRVLTLAVLFASIAIPGARRIFETMRIARVMAAIPDFEQRKLVLFGPWYASVQQIRESVPPAATVDIVMLTPAARDIAVLAAAELQPRDCRFFDGWDAWRQRERAVFLHDPLAANAIPGPPPAPAKFVVTVDPRTTPEIRVVRP